MAAEEKEAFLQRWSRRKHEEEAKKERTPAAPDTPAPELPPVEKLTPDSDFSGFMHPKVQDAVRRVALKKLFSDPHFNIPDPFEPYSIDFNAAEPIPPEMLAGLNQAKTLLFPEEEKKKKEAQAAEAEEPTEQAKSDEPPRQDA